MKTLKWLHSRLWDNTPGYLLGSWCPLWLLRSEEWLATKLPDSWFDQNDGCLMSCGKCDPTPLDEFRF